MDPRIVSVRPYPKVLIGELSETTPSSIRSLEEEMLRAMRVYERFEGELSDDLKKEFMRRFKKMQIKMKLLREGVEPTPSAIHFYNALTVKLVESLARGDLSEELTPDLVALNLERLNLLRGYLELLREELEEERKKVKMDIMLTEIYSSGRESLRALAELKGREYLLERDILILQAMKLSTYLYLHECSDKLLNLLDLHERSSILRARRIVGEVGDNYYRERRREIEAEVEAILEKFDKSIEKVREKLANLKKNISTAKLPENVKKTILAEVEEALKQIDRVADLKDQYPTL